VYGFSWCLVVFTCQGKYSCYSFSDNDHYSMIYENIYSYIVPVSYQRQKKETQNREEEKENFKEKAQKSSSWSS
jgi:hypothetical protein